MKKIAMLLICFIMTLACIAIAEEEPTVYTSGEYQYILLEDGTAQITYYFGESADVDIPENLDRYPISSIGDAAFSFCSSLTSISIPDSVTSIGFNPFAGCDNLTKIKVSPDHPTLATIDGVLFDKREQKLICYPCAFTENSYSISQGISSIGDAAFSFCSSLTDISIPDSVTSIGDNAFSYCSSLTSISIPDSVTSIGDNAFSRCSSLTSISIPDSVTSIGVWAFSGCTSLTLTVDRDSYALQYAKENGIEYTYTDALDWLNS